MKNIILSPSNKTVEYKDGDTVLSALERHGYALPNNCRAGACGECKVKMLDGEIDQGFILDMALSPQEKEDGFGLMCMAKLKSGSLTIEWGTEDAKPKLFPPEENISYVLIDKRMVSPSIVKLTLKSLRKSMRFWPGQYVTLAGPRSPKRCYSIANNANSEGEIELLVTKMEGGNTSRWVHEDLELGELVQLSGPYGTFVGDPSVDRPVLCLASGSGIAPILSLAKGALIRGGFKLPADILFSAKTKEHIVEEGILSYLDKKFRNFSFKYTLTGEENPGGLTGRIPTLLAELYPDLSGHSVFIAGNPDFVEDCKKSVLSLGGDESFIHTEGFVSQDGV